ncbi:MAG: hypothetical protein U0531_13370 [Dehalococcoidia bacterium]
MATLVVSAIALLGLAVAGWWLAREPVAKVRLAAALGGTTAFLLAFGAAQISGKGAGESVAIALLGAAVLSLALLGQMRLARRLMPRR